MFTESVRIGCSLFPACCSGLVNIKHVSGNLLMWSDLTLGPYFKVKQG